jgi:hypothetical protein
MVNIKVVDLDEFYNFHVSQIFISDHLVSQIVLVHYFLYSNIQ